MLDQMASVVSADGTQIACQRCGEGPPLVLVHGSASDHTFWAGLLPAFSERFSIYALDRRGRGGSADGSSSSYAIEREFDDVRAVIDSIGEPVCVLGHSYGAICALEAALRGGNVKRLVLYEPPFAVEDGKSIIPSGTLERMESLLDAGERDDAALVFGREIARLPEHEIAALRSTPAWQVVLEVAPTLPDEVRGADGYEFSPERCNRLTTPTLLLVGSESPPYLKAASEAVAAALPNSQVVVLEGQGHVAMHTAPEHFMHTVVQFLTDK